MKRFLFITSIVISLFFLSSDIQAQFTQTVTAGDATTAVNFPAAGCAYSWVNDNPGIGLAASGTGNIGSFTAVNTGSIPITATITATPLATGFAYIPTYSDGTVAVISTVNNMLVTTIPAGSSLVGISVSPDGSKAYVTNSTSNNVSVISTLTNSVIANIIVGQDPWGISVSPDGKQVYVTYGYGAGYISVINAVNNTVVANIDLGQNMYPVGIAVSPDGGRVYVAGGRGQDAVTVINTTTNAVIGNIAVGYDPLDVSVSPDNSRVYVTNYGGNTVSVINTLTNLVVATIPVGSYPAGITISPDGSRVYVANEGGTVSIINTATNMVIATIQIGSYCDGISVTPDGNTLYVTNTGFGNNEVSVINTSTNTVISTVRIDPSAFSLGNFITAGPGCNGTPVTFTITVNPAPPPVPAITKGTATGTISACAGTAAASPNIQQFTVSGSDLSADIVATAPNNFEISLSVGSGFGNSVTLPLSGGVVNNTVVYVRSAASSAAGPISGNVTLISGAVNSKVPVTGTVNTPPVVNPVSNQTLVNGSVTTAVNFTGTGSTYNWTNDTPGIGLATNGSGDISSFTAVNNGAGPVTATITVTTTSSGADCGSTPVTFTITVNPPLGPTITATGSLSPLNTIYGTPSTSTTFTLSGSNLTTGILVTPPSGFEVSTDGISYSPTVTIAGTGTIALTTVYIRLASSTPVGNNYSGNIVLSSTSATNVNVELPVSTVTPAPLTITADNKSKALGEANPVLTVTYNGFVNNDGPAQLTTQPTITTTALTASPAGQYPITAAAATDPNYTITYVPGVLTINPQPQTLTVPNAFTPNGDGVNDTWDIKYLNTFPNCTVTVFNCWGQNVYSSIGYGIPWDGTYHGATLPTATYYYIINLKNGLKALSGFVVVVR